jgi:hypothetical protein
MSQIVMTTKVVLWLILMIAKVKCLRILNPIMNQLLHKKNQSQVKRVSNKKKVRKEVYPNKMMLEMKMKQNQKVRKQMSQKTQHQLHQTL